MDQKYILCIYCDAMRVGSVGEQGRAARRWLSLHGLGVPLGPGAVVCMVPQATALSREPQVIAWPAGWL
jgi:hypothetical protein